MWLNPKKISLWSKKVNKMKTWTSFSNIKWEYSVIMLWESAGIYPQENKEHRENVSSHLAFCESVPSSQAKPPIIPSNHFYLAFLKGRLMRLMWTGLFSHLTIFRIFLRQYNQRRHGTTGLTWDYWIPNSSKNPLSWPWQSPCLWRQKEKDIRALRSLIF